MATFGGGAFGSQPGFGQSTSGFGGNAFGNNSAPFGGQSAFGSQSNPLFGSQPQSGSRFGQSAPFGGSAFGAQSTPAFGTGFGGQSNAAFGSGFGAQSGAAFGASGGFGSGSSLFGANRPPTGAFGSSNPFGQSHSGWAQSSSAFGGSTAFGTGGGLFASSGPSSSVFGQTTGAFGVGSQGQKGTAGASWQITTEYDAGPGQAPKYHSITMMNQFRDKSLEELRVEDYAAGFKGGNQGGAAGNTGNRQSTGLFGNTGGAFGASTGGFGSGGAFGTGGFGATSNVGGFGQSSGVFGAGGGVASTGFGQSGGGGFGGGRTVGQHGGGVFGQAGSTVGGQSGRGFGNTGNSLFPSAPGFGIPQSGSLLEAAGSGFSLPQSGSLLGATGSGFGQSQSSFGGGNVFGPGGGQSTPSLFGGNAGQPILFGGGASGFNNAGAQKSLFGSTSGTAFGNTTFGASAAGNAGGTSFGGFNTGQSAANTGFGFGGSTFGVQPGQQQAQFPNNFGASVAPAGQAFAVVPGAGNNPTIQGTLAAVTQQNGVSVAPPGANYGTVLYNLQKLQSEIGEHKKLMEQQAKTNAANAVKPPGTVSVVVLPPPSPLTFSGVGGHSFVGGYGWSGSMSQRTKTRGVAGRIGGAAARVSGTPVRSSPEVAANGVPATAASSGTDVVRRMSFFSPQNFSGALRPRTVRASELSTPIPATPKMLPLPDRPERRTNAGSEEERITSAAPSDREVSGMQNGQMDTDQSSRPQRDIQPVASLEGNGMRAPGESLQGTGSSQNRTLSLPAEAENGSVGEARISAGPRRRSRSNSSGGASEADFVWAQQRPSSWSLNRPVDSDDQYNPHKYLPSQTRPGFYTIPDLADLASRTMTELQRVDSFTVGREGYGEITWVDPVDVRGLNLDAAVDIQQGEVAVFPEKEAGQLDAPARVKLEGMFTKKKAGDFTTEEELNARYKQKLKNYCRRNDLRFIDYDPAKGEWLFEVQTFAD